MSTATSGSLVTVIGDLVASRGPTERRSRLQERLGEILSEVNDRLDHEQPLEPTVGDEYQGAYATVAQALTATLVVRLSLLPDVDVRCGLGLGEVTVHDARRTPLLQDGPGWWSAREAIETLGGSRDERRTWFSGPDAGRVNAFLLCRDQVVSRLNDRGLRMLRLGLLGHTQKEIAEIEEIWPSAVSQQYRRGISAVLEGHRLLAHEAAP